MASSLRLISSRYLLSASSKNGLHAYKSTITPLMFRSSTSSSSILSIRTQSTSSDSSQPKIKAPKMVYISGEEMTHYATQLLMQQWIEPHFDTSSWEKYDLSCKSRDDTDDQVLADAVEAGKRIGAIFKEPTITPSAIQVQEMGLKK